MAFKAYYENHSTGGSITQVFFNRKEENARKEAINLETKHRKLVRLEPFSYASSKRVETAAAREKRLIQMLWDLQDLYGVYKYNKAGEEITVRVSDHCKNPDNDSRFNFGDTVLSFTVRIWGDEFTGINNNEWDVTDLTLSKAKKLIQKKVDECKKRKQGR